MALPPDFAQHVKTVADIARVIGETVRLKKSGNNWIGLCPFHQEKTPSFHVHATKQFYHCFGCGAKGDIFRFVMETERVEFPEALRRVAQRAGIPIPAPVATEPQSPEAKLRARLSDLHEQATKFFEQQLKSAEAAPLRELIKRRGVTPAIVEEFRLGYAPASGRGLLTFLKSQGFSDEALEASGLILRRDGGGLFDRFRARWIFPIASETGRVVAFGGRALGDEQPKYLNSPETVLYSKSRVLFNIARARDAIRKANRAVIVEGYMDAIAVHQAGVANVVASCGTALTSLQAHLLSRHCPEVLVSYDPDSAGVAATDRSVTLLLEEGLSVRILRLPGKLDPDQFIREKGAEAYRAALASAPSFFTYLAGRALELHGTASPEAKLAAVNFVLPYLAKVPNGLIRSELAADISQKMDVSSGVLEKAFQKAATARREIVSEPAGGFARIPKAEAMLIRLLLEDQDLQKNLPSYLKEASVVAEFHCAEIISAIVSQLNSGLALDVMTLSDGLPKTQQQLLAEIAFEKEARPVSLSEIDVYIEALQRNGLQRERESLEKRIQQAQKSGETDLVFQLLASQMELDRRLKELV